jgi:hypothetical protein
LGFEISYQQVLQATLSVNEFLCTLTPILFKNIDFKTTGAMIGAIFCSKIIEFVPETIVNPIEKGHPDIVPCSALNENINEFSLRNYPEGLEIKGTIGNITQGANLRAGVKRINSLTGITWQAHHREVNNLMGIVWDFVSSTDDENFFLPAITAVFFSDELNTDDWGAISGLTGRNTKVSGMVKSGKDKMGQGTVLIIDDEIYIRKYSKFLGIPKDLFE